MCLENIWGPNILFEDDVLRLEETILSVLKRK